MSFDSFCCTKKKEIIYLPLELFYNRLTTIIANFYEKILTYCDQLF